MRCWKLAEGLIQMWNWFWWTWNFYIFVKLALWWCKYRRGDLPFIMGDKRQTVLGAEIKDPTLTVWRRNADKRIDSVVGFKKKNQAEFTFAKKLPWARGILLKTFTWTLVDPTWQNYIVKCIVSCVQYKHKWVITLICTLLVHLTTIPSPSVQFQD